MKLLPHNDEAEMALIGCLILSGAKAMPQVVDHVTPDDLYDDANRTIFRICREAWEADEPLDLLLLRSKLLEQNGLDKIGGMAYLQRLVEIVPSSANADRYARIVRESSRRRKIAIAATDLARIAGDGWDPGTASEIYGRLGAAVHDEPVQRAAAVADVLGAVKDQAEPMLIGMPELDNPLRGLHRQDLVLLASRPSVGKTSLALNILYRMCWTYRGLLHSLESSQQEIGFSLLSIAGGKERETYRGKLDEGMCAEISRGMADFSELRLLIDDRPGITIGEIAASAERLARSDDGLDVLVIDYLGLIAWAGNERPVYEIGKIARQAKMLARRFNIVVMLIVQLNRGNDKECRKPRLSDLRDSGELEQHGDVVIFLHDPIQFAEDDDEKERLENGWFDKRKGKHMPGHKGEVNVIIGKNRFGERRDFWIRFEARCLRFGNWEKQLEF